MKSLENALNEFEGVRSILVNILSCLRVIRDSNISHSAAIDQKYNELKIKREKLPLSHIENTLMEILLDEKDLCSVKASFLSVTSIPSIEATADRNKSDLEICKVKCRELAEGDSKLVDQIEKLKKIREVNLSNYFKIQGLCNKRRESFNNKEIEVAGYFHTIASSINTSLEAICHDIQRYATFTLQLKNKSVDQLKIFFEAGEDYTLNANSLRSVMDEELMGSKDRKSNFIYKEKIKVKTFLGGWKESTIFLFPTTLLVASSGYKKNQEKQEVEKLDDFNYETKLTEVELGGIKFKRLGEDRIKLNKKSKNLIQILLGTDSLEMQFSTGVERENFANIIGENSI